MYTYNWQIVNYTITFYYLNHNTELIFNVHAIDNSQTVICYHMDKWIYWSYIWVYYITEYYITDV